jgi:hypothetical protein
MFVNIGFWCPLGIDVCRELQIKEGLPAKRSLFSRPCQNPIQKRVQLAIKRVPTWIANS